MNKRTSHTSSISAPVKTLPAFMHRCLGLPIRSRMTLFIKAFLKVNL